MSCIQFTSDWQLTEKNRLGTYLAHAVHGVSIRALARRQGVHPSTILRRVRKIELRRDDPLVDEALDHLAAMEQPDTSKNGAKSMTKGPDDLNSRDKTAGIIRNLKTLSEDGSFLAVASDLEDAAIFRRYEDGEIRRILVIGRDEAMVLALNDWVELTQSGRMSRYQITTIGRKALKRMIAKDEPRQGFAEASTPFMHQHIEWGTRVVHGDSLDEITTHVVNAAESPVTLLARRKGRDGKPYIGKDLVTAGERLREDFELANMGSRVTQNWEMFMTGRLTQTMQAEKMGDGAGRAYQRFQAAMQFLGPGLSDIALQCCCFQKGLETAEKQLGWSARSGKVVLKIALQRLNQHYQEYHGSGGPLIG